MSTSSSGKDSENVRCSYRHIYAISQEYRRGAETQPVHTPSPPRKTAPEQSMTIVTPPKSRLPFNMRTTFSELSNPHAHAHAHTHTRKRVRRVECVPNDQGPEKKKKSPRGHVLHCLYPHFCGVTLEVNKLIHIRVQEAILLRSLCLDLEACHCQEGQ